MAIVGIGRASEMVSPFVARGRERSRQHPGARMGADRRVDAAGHALSRDAVAADSVEGPK